MIKLMLCSTGLFVAGVAWVTANKKTEKNQNKLNFDKRNNSKNNNENNFLDFSDGLLGI